LQNITLSFAVREAFLIPAHSSLHHNGPNSRTKREIGTVGVDYHFFVKGRLIIPELTLALPDDLYVQLQARAADKGMPLEGFIRSA
jgi:hypothetical protein